MEIYTVGGAVRDALLGLPVQDRDFVVVGATPQQMLQRGFTPVGKDFPVFLHPKTHEEYALARTERKTAPGYRGFLLHADSEVTLEQDLARRDLTINAIARAGDGSLIDPFGGQRDLAARVFRHVSAAFAEDPVRILRLARFAARFALPPHDFQVAPETNLLMRQMVAAGEVDALVPERIWQELARGLQEALPSRMFAVLRDCGALARLLPELDALWGARSRRHPETDAGLQAMLAIDVAARQNMALPGRFAVLLHDLDMVAVAAVCERLRVPHDCRDLALLTAREYAAVSAARQLDADAIVCLIERCDALRKPQRFAGLLQAVACSGQGGADQPQPEHLLAALAAVQAVDAGRVAADIAQAYPGQPQRIAPALHAARTAALAALLRAGASGP
ncbi:multifunctional CCA addition/repair protein [Herminiimonas sp. CN]|uniref:multifunctional CCA addition/repair protein n=1 Tax=Herminiimonas sp. CN TaxID=1349818 RepID=UPI0004731B2D|nr:multifunctional CCA addition/repair protein [Herminiimonas sp. CN]